MSSNQVTFSNSIVGAMNYLIREAHDQGSSKVARILGICLRDICIALEFDGKNDGIEEENDGESCAVGSDLFYATDFLVKYSSIKDEKIKKDVLKMLEHFEQRLALH